MPKSKHAVLSASSSHQWLSCTPSARLEQEFSDSCSEAAAEGTAAHALAEHKLKRALKRRSQKPISPYDCDEMDECTDGYVQFVLETLSDVKKSCADPLAPHRTAPGLFGFCPGRFRYGRLPDRRGSHAPHY